MARWKLATAHYLNTLDPAEWEYTETDRTTGKPIRRKFPVPRYLDPRDPADWTSRWGNKDNPEGEILVCLPGKGERGDIEFLGDPTPDMIPMDEEATAISESFAKQWSYKPDVDAPGLHSQSLIDKFQLEMAEKQSAPTKVEIPGLQDLVAAIAEQGKNTAEVLKSLNRRGS